MSPRPKHIPANAHQTSISLTDEEQFAVSWIRTVRRQRGEDRKTLNDILVDALWYLLEKKEGKTKAEIHAMIPPAQIAPIVQGNITEMPKPKPGR